MAGQLLDENTKNSSQVDQGTQYPKHLHYSVALFTFIVAVFSITGNILTIMILKSQKRNGQQIRLYRIQLALSHIISPVGTYWMLIVSSLQGTWVFGQFGCIFYGFLQGFCAIFSILLVAAIAYNRATSLKLVTPAPLYVSVHNSIILWTVTFVLCSPPVFGWNRYIIDGFGTTCCFDLHSTDIISRTFVIYILLFGFIIPLVIIFFSYRRVCVVLFKSAMFRQRSKSQSTVKPGETKNLQATSSSSGSPRKGASLCLFPKLMIIWRDRQNFQNQIRPLRTMLIITVCFVCIWLPYAILAVMGLFISFKSSGPYLEAAAGLIAKSYVAFDPVICVLTDETFRARMWDILRRRANS